MLVGLGAPIYRRLFAPERDLIRAMALRRLCQYRAAHLAVRDFREHYGALVRKARDREGLREDPQIEQWAAWGTRLAPWARMRTRLRTEKALASRVGDARWPNICRLSMASVWPTPRTTETGLASCRRFSG